MGRRDNQQQNTSQLGRRDRTTQSQTVTQPTPAREGNFLTNAPSNLKMLARGDIKARDVVRNVPGVVKRGAVKTAEVVTPALTNFTKTTGGILGEGVAYAIDPNVRKQYRAGNTEILPHITKTSQKDLLIDTLAAGIETAVIRSSPKAFTGTKKVRATIGGLEGIGFAVAEGLAKGQSVNEILKNAGIYGVTASALGVALPWLKPLLKKEIGRAPKAVVTALKKEAEEATSVISYINKEDEKVYTTLTREELESLRDEVRVIPEPSGNESQIHLDAKTSTLESQGKLISRDEFIAGHSQAGDVLGGPKGRRVPLDATQQPIQAEQIPIGGPTKGASRLEARLVAEAEDPVRKAGVSNYARYSNKADAPEVTGSSNPEQIKRATTVVENSSPAEINAVVSGNTPVPDGVLRTAYLKAATEKALLEGNSGLVNRLSRAVGQLARRFGQEIQFTKNFDQLDPVTNIADILAVRLKAAERRMPKGVTVRTETKKALTEATGATKKSQLKFDEAEKLIDSILC